MGGLRVDRGEMEKLGRVKKGRERQARKSVGEAKEKRGKESNLIIPLSKISPAPYKGGSRPEFRVVRPLKLRIF